MGGCQGVYVFLGKGNERKINKWDFIELNNFCRAKETTNKRSRQPTDGEKIFTMIHLVRG